MHCQTQKVNANSILILIGVPFIGLILKHQLKRT